MKTLLLISLIAIAILMVLCVRFKKDLKECQESPQASEISFRVLNNQEYNSIMDVFDKYPPVGIEKIQFINEGNAQIFTRQTTSGGVYFQGFGFLIYNKGTFSNVKTK